MARLALAAAMMTAALVACAADEEDSSAPLVPAAAALDVAPACAAFRVPETPPVTRVGSMVELPAPWAARETFDLGKPHSTYAVTDAAASCATGWVERETTLELIGTTLHATFREYEVGCKAAPACETRASFTLD